MTNYETQTLIEAAALMAVKDQNLTVTFVTLKPTAVKDRFYFCFNIEEGDQAAKKFKDDFINRRVLVEPRALLDQMNMLRDNTTNAKGGFRS